MISRHHSPLVQPSNSGRASTWSIFAESAAESLSQMGTEVSSDRPGPAMRSKYPERASTTGNEDLVRHVVISRDRVLPQLRKSVAPAVPKSGLGQVPNRPGSRG